ncbi:MAG: B12-binding domain-containing radical SAM protein [Candidatus Omnitrophica bacterium]|nr:B12-binding domain-containing radical SAM protein [Candidatus Omnitrophota bacterium]
MKVLIIYPSNFFSSKWGKSYPFKPHLLSLLSILRLENDADILDLEMEIGKPDTNRDIEQFGKKARQLISRYKFDVVGISCWSSHNYLSSLLVARICKEVNKDSIVVAGGYHPSALPGDFIYEGSPFDFVIKGEGENSFFGLCREIKKRRHDISGMDRVIQGAPLDLNGSMDLLDWKGYKYLPLHKGKQILLYLSRGCPFSCSFCMEHSKGHRAWRSYSVENAIRVVEEAIDIVRPVDVIICDPCFGMNKNWRRRFLSGLIRRKIDKIFWAAVRADTIEKEDVDLFSKLNFILYIGLETGSEKMARIMRKAEDPKDYLKKSREIIAYLNEKKVFNLLHVLVNHPGESYETFKETIGFLKSIVMDRRHVSSVFLGQSFFFYPGSYVYNNIDYYEKEYGTVIVNKEWWKQEGDHYKLAYENIPSTALIKKVKKMDYWKKEFDYLYDYSRQRIPAEIKLLLLKSAEKGVRF